MRSARSRPTGPGSRGGHWHLAAFRAAYYRDWRAAHPDYVEREHGRLSRRRAFLDEPARTYRCPCPCGELATPKIFSFSSALRCGDIVWRAAENSSQ